MVNEPLIAFPISANHFLSTAFSAAEGSDYPAAAGEAEAGALAATGPEASEGRRSLSRRPTAAQPGRKARSEARQHSARHCEQLATRIRGEA